MTETTQALTDRERVAVALFERWEDEGEADPDRSENYERESWDGIDEADRDHWRGWADAALAALNPTEPTHRFGVGDDGA